MRLPLNALIAALLALGSGLAGYVCGRGFPLVALLLPWLSLLQANRARAALGAFCFYLGAGTDILATGAYLATANLPLPPVLLWLAAAILQTLPWLLCWTPEPVHGRVTTALMLSALPPLSLISWAHPFHSAGLLFPGLGVAGIVLLIVMLEAAMVAPTVALALVGVAGVANLSAIDPPVPAEWMAVRTDYGDVMRHPDPFAIQERVVTEIGRSPAQVLVWPESYAGQWNEASELFWTETLQHARAKQKTLVLGAAVSLAGPSRGYRNVALIQGREVASLDQRTPVPLAMWNTDGVAVRWFASPVKEVNGRRVAFLICYEQLLAWSYMPLLLDRPELIAGLANVYWVRDTSVAQVQSACMRSWARLFAIPVVEAVNR